MSEENTAAKRIVELIEECGRVRRQIRKPRPYDTDMKQYKALQKYWKERVKEIELEMRTIYLNEVFNQILEIYLLMLLLPNYRRSTHSRSNIT